MRQRGIVVEIKGSMARVECDRRSACDMCENAAHCVEKCKKVYTEALNTVNASVGDTVEIETDTGKLLFNTFVLFMIPVFLGVASYFVFDSFFGEGLTAALTLAVLAGSLGFIAFLLNKRAKNKTVSRIVRIL